MLTSKVMTAIKQLGLVLMAVFFSQNIRAADSSLYSIERGLNDLIFELSRSVVTVESYRKVPLQEGITGTGNEALQNLVSTGIVCDTFGHILVYAPTVVGQEKINVNLNNRIYPAELIAVDYYHDLALLQTKSRVGLPVHYSDRYVCAGQMIISIGNAYGLRASPSIGFCAGSREDGRIQVSVPITASMVGGGVFDLSGGLLGIIIGIVGEENQTGLAVPAYLIPGIIDHLTNHGDRHAGFIGISTAEIEISPSLEVHYPTSLASDKPTGRVIDRGVIITDVLAGSPASHAGLKKGDLILSFNNLDVISPVSLSDEVRRSLPGHEVVMELLRGQTLVNSSLTVGERSTSLYPADIYLVDTSENNPRVADSLRVVIEQLKSEIQKIENRLNSLK